MKRVFKSVTSKFASVISVIGEKLYGVKLVFTPEYKKQEKAQCKTEAWFEIASRGISGSCDEYFLDKNINLYREDCIRHYTEALLVEGATTTDWKWFFYRWYEIVDEAAMLFHEKERRNG